MITTPTRLAAALLVAGTLSFPAAAGATCTIPGHRTVPAGSQIVLKFGAGVSKSVQDEFRKVVARVGPTVNSGTKPWVYNVVSHTLSGENHGITSAGSAGGKTTLIPSIAGGNWTAGSTTKNHLGESEYVLTIVWHEAGHAWGLGHPNGSSNLRASACPDLAGKTVMFHYTADDGRPGDYGPVDWTVLHRVYGK